jgi:hypothetical protein
LTVGGFAVGLTLGFTTGLVAEGLGVGFADGGTTGVLSACSVAFGSLSRLLARSYAMYPAAPTHAITTPSSSTMTRPARFFFGGPPYGV